MDQRIDDFNDGNGQNIISVTGFTILTALSLKCAMHINLID